jgi:hypothetical protein
MIFRFRVPVYYLDYQEKENFMSRKKKTKEQEKKPSLLKIQYKRYKEATVYLSEGERKCLLLLIHSIENAIKTILKRINFRSPMNIEQFAEALLYEELIFFIPIVTEKCRKIREEVNNILNNLEIQRPSLKETI